MADSKTPWTPGPWSIGEAQNGEIAIVADEVWIIAVKHGALYHPKGTANARLIAAAPEMAEVVRLYLDWGELSPAALEAKYPEWDRADGVSFIDTKAHALLAKIGGEA